MSRRRQFASPWTKQRAKATRFLQWCLANLGFVALGGSALCVMFAMSTLSPTNPSVLASGTGGGTSTANDRQGTIHPTCNMPGLPACAPVEGWIALRSASGADIIAAARQSTLFKVDRSTAGDHLNDISRLGVPQLIQALHVARKANAPDYFVIPIEDASGQTVGSAELQLNAAHTAVMVAAIITYTKPYAANALTWMTPTAAIAAVQTQHHVSPGLGRQPRLVYYPGDTLAQQSGRAHWVSGQSPAEPVWAVPGADGQDHIVAADGRVYLPSELPIASA